MACHPQHLGPLASPAVCRELIRFTGNAPAEGQLVQNPVLQVVKIASLAGPDAAMVRQRVQRTGAQALMGHSGFDKTDLVDILLIGTTAQLTRAASLMADASEALTELGRQLHLLVGRIGQRPKALYGAGGVCLTLDRPRIMGIVNVTPDSFSDGGRFVKVEAAIDQARRLVQEGADLIDIGGESTRPGALGVSAQQEMDRVLPVIEGLCAQSPVPISIDTTKSDVAEAALRAGATFVNDISGLTFDAHMASVVAHCGAGLFVMHTRGRPETMQTNTVYTDLVSEVTEALRRSVETALSAGVLADHLAVDPGIGFGKDVQGNLQIMRHLQQLHGLGYPVLLGTSRKSFIGQLLGHDDPSQRLNGTLATLAFGVTQGVQIFRVHDVRAAKDVVQMTHALVAPAAGIDPSS